jgi:predicted RNase H-like nuclease
MKGPFTRRVFTGTRHHGLVTDQPVDKMEAAVPPRHMERQSLDRDAVLQLTKEQLATSWSPMSARSAG